MSEQDYLLESIKTIRNLGEIGILLRNVGRNELLPTVLELLLVEAQQVVDEHCIVDRTDS